MSFPTQIFLFIFFPVCLLCYYIAVIMEKNRYVQWMTKKLRIKDIVLIVFSMGFYMWACFDDVFWLIIYMRLEKQLREGEMGRFYCLSRIIEMLCLTTDTKKYHGHCHGYVSR